MWEGWGWGSPPDRGGAWGRQTSCPPTGRDPCALVGPLHPTALLSGSGLRAMATPLLSEGAPWGHRLCAPSTRDPSEHPSPGLGAAACSWGSRSSGSLCRLGLGLAGPPCSAPLTIARRGRSQGGVMGAWGRPLSLLGWVSLSAAPHCSPPGRPSVLPRPILTASGAALALQTPRPLPPGSGHAPPAPRPDSPLPTPSIQDPHLGSIERTPLPLYTPAEPMCPSEPAPPSSLPPLLQPQPEACLLQEVPAIPTISTRAGSCLPRCFPLAVTPSEKHIWG